MPYSVKREPEDGEWLGAARGRSSLGLEDMLGADKYVPVMIRLALMVTTGQRDAKTARAEAERNAVTTS